MSADTPRPAGAEPPLIDTHAHVYRLAMPMPSSAWHRPKADALLQDYLETIDRAGVTFAVLAAASIFGDYNDYMIEAVRAHQRLRTTVILAPDADPYMLRQMKADGVVGIRLQFRNVDPIPDLASYEYQRFFRRVADLGWHVHVHDQGDRLAQHIPHVENAGPRLVIDHFGRPSGGVESLGFQAVLAAVDRGRTWVKMAAPFRLAAPCVVQALTAALLSRCGPERLMWGSDWPFAAYEDTMTYETALAAYYASVPDAAVRRQIDRTALSFYFS